MDFPIFELPYLGTRYLIAIVAVLHVLVNHGAAIGGSLLTVMLERKGWREQDPRYEALAYRLAAVFFVLTTTVGAMTGVGIWFSTMVGEPAAIGSMLRIFFWAWFTEWIVFVVEVGLIMAYFLSWKRFQDKRRHLQLGWAYVAASVGTMVIVTGILGFMISPGNWNADHQFSSAFFNPTYLPQLVLRLGLALALAACGTLAILRWLVPPDFRADAARYVSRFVLASVPFVALGGLWYMAMLPEQARMLMPTALLTSSFAPYVQASYVANALVCLFLAIAAACGLRYRLPTAIGLAMWIAAAGLLGQFERVREFARKPFIIPGYMYANGLRVADSAAYQRDGVLAHAHYVGVSHVTPSNHLTAGHAVFRLECAACHTLGGANDPLPHLKGLSAEGIDPFLGVLHQAHPFMPPFQGTPAERRALAEFLASQAAKEATLAKQDPP